MIKKGIYPKTTRLSLTPMVTITEKLDGSNLGFFKLANDLYIAQRSTVYSLSEIEEQKDIMYKGLYGWLQENGEYLRDNIYEGSVIFGEWIGMGKIKYGETLDKRFYMFAKARIDDTHEVTKLQYSHDGFPFVFGNKMPDFIGVVPVVEVAKTYSAMTVEYLNSLYETYKAQVNRDVEGFILQHNGSIVKYVRYKDGKLCEHFDRGE